MQISETLSLSTLSVENQENTLENCKLISRIGKAWQQSASKRKMLSNDLDKIQIFNNAIAISQYLSQFEKISQKEESIVFCINKATQKIEAIAIYTIQTVFESSGKNFGSCFKINVIITNPKNIKLFDTQNSA